MAVPCDRVRMAAINAESNVEFIEIKGDVEKIYNFSYLLEMAHPPISH